MLKINLGEDCWGRSTHCNACVLRVTLVPKCEVILFQDGMRNLYQFIGSFFIELVFNTQNLYDSDKLIVCNAGVHIFISKDSSLRNPDHTQSLTVTCPNTSPNTEYCKYQGRFHILLTYTIPFIITTSTSITDTFKPGHYYLSELRGKHNLS